MTSLRLITNTQGNALTRRLLQLADAFHQSLLDDLQLRALVDNLLDCCEDQIERVTDLRIAAVWQRQKAALIGTLEELCELADNFDTMCPAGLYSAVRDIEDRLIALEGELEAGSLGMVA